MDEKDEVEWGTDWDAEVGTGIDLAPAKELNSSSGKFTERLDGNDKANKGT